MTMKYLKTGYRVAYRYLEKRPPETSEYSMTSFINTLMGMKFSSFIDDYDPDAVICTHPFAAQLLNEMKRRGWLAAPVIGIVTDYTLPPIWSDVSFVEYIVLPSEVFLSRCKSAALRKTASSRSASRYGTSSRKASEGRGAPASGPASGVPGRTHHERQHGLRQH